MADVHDKATRSYNMSRIRSKDTKPELIVRKFLFSNGFRYRLNDKNLPGKPDIVLAKYKTAIFVQGCFWHGHENCKYYRIPETRKKWWMNKLCQTKNNDEKNQTLLKTAGWKVIVVWECELKKEKKEKTLLYLIEEFRCQ
mgnify:CR=1 FL=1